MKKFFILFCSLVIGLSTSAFTQDNINAKLLLAFRASFPNAEEVNWYESKENYVVNFKENAIRTRIVYSKDGKMVNLTRSYQEQNLPYHIHLKVKQEYNDKKIFGIVEVTEVDESSNYSTTEYYIKLEDEKNWYTLKMDNDGSMSIVEKFKKN